MKHNSIMGSKLEVSHHLDVIRKVFETIMSDKKGIDFSVWNDFVVILNLSRFNHRRSLKIQTW